MKMLAGLVRFSSLRTQPSPAFETRPVSLNGRVVEEAIRLPIAGIDLVATRPGLPVSALHILEEAPTLGDAPPSDEPETPERERRTFSVPPIPDHGARSESAGHEETTDMKCPFCAADLKTEDAVAHMTTHASEHTRLKEEKTSLEGKVTSLEGKVTSATEEAASAKAELATAKAAAAASAAGASEELQTLLREQKAEIAALTAKVAATEELASDMAAFKLERTIRAKVDEMYAKARAKDAGLADFILPLVEEASAKLTTADGVALLWYETVEEQAAAYYRSAMRMPSGRGFVHLPAARGTEEQRKPAGAGAAEEQGGQGGTQRRAAEEDEGGQNAHAQYSPEAQSILANFR